jgi:hypothetical protein
MRKPISTKTHGIIDFITAGTTLLLPRIMNCSDELKNAVTMMGLTKLAYSICTRHELGLIKAIPMKAHLAMDAVSGTAMAALPFVLEEEEPGAIACCVAMGLGDVAVSAMTETSSTVESRGVFRSGRFRNVSAGRSPVVA